MKRIIFATVMLLVMTIANAQTWIYEANTTAGMISGVMRATQSGFTFQIGQDAPINFVYRGIVNNCYCYQSTNMNGQQIYGYKSQDASRVQIGNIVFVYSSRNAPAYNPITDNSGNGNSKRLRFITESCSYCKGSKRNPQREYAPQYDGAPARYFYCDICKDYDRAHGHKLCPACGGSGEQKRSVYE